MNFKITITTFLILLLAMLFYPPFFWTTKDVSIDTAIRSQLPVKKHALIFGPSSQKFQLKHFPEKAATQKSPQTNSEVQDRLKNYSDEELEMIVGIIPLQRSLAWPDLGVEIVIGLAISIFVGVVVPRRKGPPNESVQRIAEKAGSR